MPRMAAAGGLHLWVGAPVGQRLKTIQAARERQLGRKVSMSEVVEMLLAEWERTTGLVEDVKRS